MNMGKVPGNKLAAGVHTSRDAKSIYIQTGYYYIHI
jgi:hypothetical protein